jgi:hypothetical protein
LIARTLERIKGRIAGFLAVYDMGPSLPSPPHNYRIGKHLPPIQMEKDRERE